MSILVIVALLLAILSGVFSLANIVTRAVLPLIIFSVILLCLVELGVSL